MANEIISNEEGVAEIGGLKIAYPVDPRAQLRVDGPPPLGTILTVLVNAQNAIVRELLRLRARLDLLEAEPVELDLDALGKRGAANDGAPTPGDPDTPA